MTFPTNETSSRTVPRSWAAKQKLIEIPIIILAVYCDWSPQNDEICDWSLQNDEVCDLERMTPVGPKFSDSSKHLSVEDVGEIDE